MMIRLKYFFTVVIFLFSCTNAESQRKQASTNYIKQPKINGVNFVAPPREIDNQWTNDLKNINVGWTSLIPYAYSRPNLPQVNYSAERQHWGESVEGLRTNVKQAHEAGLKVMIKPQVWMQRGGWIGDFDLNTEEEWKIWEADYEKYIMYFAKLAAEENVEMICIGTEYRNAVKKRPAFWLKLTKDIRAIYSGKLTYCANWDDYEDVSFWKALDFVGVSAYFPLSEAQKPSVKELEKAWIPIKEKLQKFSQKEEKPILFTEYGYRSMDQPAWRSWELEYQERPINNEAQAIAYEALYKTFWKEKWFAGGFAWKWYSSFRRMDPNNNHDWTPQNKKAQEVMAEFYSSHL
ncbi:glycoside hydrolase family 113 [Pedobacter alpinus]|uniref:Glycoside hydrolase n=1 Tax=Pedobacter alpinus TaxID=1590643 RepID=A0ABW5TV74_9SPHI